MIKLVVVQKQRRGRHSPSARTLRRAIRPSRIKMGPRVAIFLILFALVVGWIGISITQKFEAWEHRHHSLSQPHGK